MAFILHKQRHAVTTKKYQALAARVGRHGVCPGPAALGPEAHIRRPCRRDGGPHPNETSRSGTMRSATTRVGATTVTVDWKGNAYSPRQQTAVPRHPARSPSRD